MTDKIGFLFPGQGAQFPGMGRDFYESYPEAKEIFDTAGKVFGAGFIDIIFNGPEEKLQLTEYTQPAILTVSTAIYRVLQKLGYKAEGMAGLSLGEYSALVAAEAMSFEDALPLVQKRGLFMQEAVPVGQGKMMALMGLSHNEVEKICCEASSKGLVTAANYNCPGQIVISGTVEAVDYAAEIARETGAKKLSELKVSAPFHCKLLEPVESKLSAEIDRIKINEPAVPVVFNITAGFEEDPGRIKENLIKQVSSPILWEQSVRKMIDFGINTFICVGPGSSLSRLMKRIAPHLITYSVETVEAVSKESTLRTNLLTY